MSNNLSTIKERILQFADFQEGNKQKFFRRIGMTYGNFTGDSKNRPINSNAIDKIFSIYPNLNLEWLISGDGEMLKEKALASRATADNGLPLVSSEAVAGFGSANFSIDKQDIQAYYSVPDFHGIDFMVRVKGNSMYPKYSSGDIIACRILKQSKFIEWNKPHLIATIEHGLIVKRLRQSDDKGYLTAISDNKDYAPFQIPETEITGLAIIIGVIRLE